MEAVKGLLILNCTSDTENSGNSCKRKIELTRLMDTILQEPKLYKSIHAAMKNIFIATAAL